MPLCRGMGMGNGENILKELLIQWLRWAMVNPKWGPNNRPTWVW